MIYCFLQQIIGVKSYSNLQPQKKCQGTCGIFERILELKLNKVGYLIQSPPSPSLRGGGCGRSKTKSQLQITIPMNYLQTMKQNCQLLIDKCDQLLDRFSRNEIMMSIQWFSDNRFWICEICKNDNLILMLYDVALNSFRQLLSVIPVYLRGSGCLCYYVLEICNDLLLIIYTYQLNDERRYLIVELHCELLSAIDIIKNDLEINKNFWTNGLEFQITLIKIVLINSKTNSTEQKDKLISIATSAFSSLLSLSISQDFTNALFDFAKYQLIEKFNQYNFPIQTYQIYYFFFLLKWNIIKDIQEKNVVNKQIESLQRGYEQYVQNSDNWIVHFCWINAISDLIAYRQIISKNVFLKSLQQKQLWNELIKQHIIQVLPYDKLLGKVNNDFSFKSIDYQSEQTLINLGVKKMKCFQNAILNQQFSDKQNFFQFYVNFNFLKQKKPEEKNSLSQQLELLGADEQMKKLNRLCQLLKEIKERISEQYFESLDPNPSQEIETKNNVYQYDLVVDKEREAQQLDFNLFKLSYLLNEVNFTMIIEKKRMEICQEQAKMTENQKEKENHNKKEKNKLICQIDDQQKQLENIYTDWIKLDIPKQYNQIFDLITKHRGLRFKFSKVEKIESKEKQMQSQENDLNIFIRDAQILIEKDLQELNIQQQSLQNFWRVNKSVILKEDEQLDQKMHEFFLDIIERDKVQFMNDEQYHKEFKESLIQQNFQTIEEIQRFNSNILNYLKMMKILQGQYLQKIYIFTKLELNFKSTLESKQSKVIIQQKNDQLEQISINELISEQQKDIEKQIQKDIQDKNDIQRMLDSIVTLRNKIIVNFAFQQSCQVSQALILQTQLYNSLYKFKLSSQQDLDQFKKDIIEIYLQYKEIQILNFNQQENSRDQDQPESIEQNGYLIHLSQKLTEWNKYLMNIHNITNKMEVLSKYVHQNCMGLLYLTEDNFQKHFLENVKSIIKELINQLELDKLLNEFIQNMLDKTQTDENLFKIKVNFSLKDFANIFCYDQGTSEINVQIEKEYQEILDYLKQEMVVERKIYDFSKDYIVRECFLFHLMKIQSQVPEKELLLLCQEYIKRIWMIEKDESVRALLKNKEMIEMQKLLFSHDLKTLSASIKEEMNQKLKEMDEIEQVIRFEGNQSNRDKLQKQLTSQYEEFEEFLDNISEMSQQLDITLIFLKELQKNVKLIKKKIDDLQESINEIGNDVRKLRGKKYEELFQIRKEKVLQYAYILELDSVYIPLKTQEVNPVTGQVQNTIQGSQFSELLVEDVKQNIKEGREGEVNQFIYEEENKDVMLIKGLAGSGKSRAARKIEEYLWKQNLDQKDWIPIYISLPQLKNPKFNLLDQALESENYGFDKLQLKDFKEAIQNNKIQVVMILDSYDEMKQDCIQSNLILTNRLIQDLDLHQINQRRKVKFIITTRKEILTSLGYQTWFYGESLQTFKEVEIMNFDKQQSESYLNHYVKLSIKRRIKSQYDFVKQVKQQQFDVQEFLEIWNKILDQLGDQEKENSDQLLSDEQIKDILEIIKKQPTFQHVQENQLILLKKELKELWSASLFNRTIENLNIYHFLQTPFMLEIVVQTLPSLSKKYKGSNEIKEMFQNNFLLLKNKENLSKKLLLQYSSQEEQIEQDITEETKIQQRQIEPDQEYQQDLKSLKVILEKLESQRFFENYSITDISLLKNQLTDISNDDLKVVISALKMKIFTIYEFYQNFIEFYHEQQIQKLRQLGKVDNLDSFTIDLVQFSESLAIEMTIHQTTQVNYEQKGKLQLKNHYFDQNNEDNWKMKYFNDLEDEYKKLVRSSALINMKGKNYSFNHKSLQEFYVAQHINNVIDKLELKDNQLTNNSQTYLKNSLFHNQDFNISLENYSGTLSILKQQLKLKDENSLKLISMVKLSTNKEFLVVSSNSFCILSYLQVYLGEQDFQGINIEKTTLKGLSFFNSRFQHSIFKEVIIDSCLFDEANLEKSKWNSMICSEKPFLEGHKGCIVIIQYSNDGKLIASADLEKIVKFWDMLTFQQIGEISDISGEPKFLVFSADDQLLFICSDKNIIETWLVTDLQNIKKSEYKIMKQEKIIQMQLSSNEKELIVVDEQGLIQFFDVNLIKQNFNQKDGFILKSSESEIKFISFFQKGEMLASLSKDNKVTLWNVKEQKVSTVIELSFQITYVIINQTSELLYCVCESSDFYGLAVWNIQNINQPYLLLTSSKYQIENILSTTDNQKSIYNLRDAIVIQSIEDLYNLGYQYQITNCSCIDFSLDENLIATGDNKYIIIWGLFTYTPIMTFEIDFSVYELLFIDNGKKLLSGEYPQVLRIWSMETCQLIATLENSYYKNITISPDFDKVVYQIYGDYQELGIISLSQNQFKTFEYNDIRDIVFSVSQNDQLIVKNLNNRNLVVGFIKGNETIKFENNSKKLRKCVFSHQSSLLARCYEDLTIEIWFYEELKFNQKFEIKLDCKISSMVFSYDDKYLALPSLYDKIILIWDFGQNQLYSLQESINDQSEYKNYIISPEICFSCDSLWVAFYNNEEIKIWKFISEQSAVIFKGDEKYIRTIESSPKQNFFATSGEELNIKFWHFETKQLIYQFETGELIKSLCFTYDGKYLISARNVLKLWDISNFPQLKLLAAQDAYYNQNVQRIFCLHQKQGILYTCSSESRVIQFDDFKYLGVLESSDNSQIQTSFSADGRYVVGGINEKVVMWNIESNCKIQFSFPLPDTIESVEYCQDQERLIVTIQSGIYILNIKSKNLLEVIPNLKSAFYAKMFINEGYLYTKESKSVKIWRNDGDNKFTLIDYYSISYQEKFVFSKDGKYLVKVLDKYRNSKSAVYAVNLIGQHRFINNQDLSIIAISNNSQYIIYGNQKLSKLSYFESNVLIEEFSDLGVVEFSPDDCNIVSRNNYKITIYNIKSKQIISQVQTEKAYYNSLLFSNCGKTLIVVDKQICLFNITDIYKPQFIGILSRNIYSANPKTSSNFLANIMDQNSILFTDMIARKFIKSIVACDAYSLKDLVILQNEQKVAYLEYNTFKVKDLIEQNQENNYYEIKENCDTLSISKDRKNVVFSSGQQIYCYENRNHKEFNKLELGVKLVYISFSQDSKFLAGCGNNKTIYFWDFKARKVVAKFQGHSEKVNVVQISQDNSTLASASDDKLIRLWNLNANLNKISQDGHEDKITNIVFSADTLVLYSGSLDKTLKLWDMQHKNLLFSKTFDFNIYSFSITRNQECFLIVQGGTIEQWNIQYNQAFQKSKYEIIPCGQSSCNFTIKSIQLQVQLFSNDNLFITLSLNSFQEIDQNYYYFSLVGIWKRDHQIEESDFMYEYAEIEIRLYEISQDFKYICSVDSHNQLTLGKLLQTSQPIITKLKQYNTKEIIQLLFSNDSKMLSTADREIVIFRILDGDELLCSLKINIDPCGFLQYFTADDKWYYTNFNNSIYLWDINHLIKDQNFSISQLELVLENLDIQCFTISNNLQHLAIGLNNSHNNNILRIVELNSMETIKTIQQNSKINLLLFSDDDLLLAVVNELNEIFIYEIDQFSLKHSFKCHQTEIIMMKFFYHVEPYQIENKNDEIQKNEQSNNLNVQSDQIERIEESNKNINQKQILSIISFDKNSSILINHLDNFNNQNQKIQLPNNSDHSILQVVFSKDVQKLVIITQDINSKFECNIYCWLENDYRQLNSIQHCRIADFSFDQNYLVYSNQQADLYLLDSKNCFYQANYIQYDNDGSRDPFNFLRLNSEKSILFAGNTEQMFCWKLCIEKNMVQLILLKIIKYDNFDYSTMFIKQESQIFFLKNNKIQKLDFSDAIGKLKACLIYYQEKPQRHGYDDQIKTLIVPKIEFKNCSFSSDLSLCVSVGQGELFVDKKKRYSNKKAQENVYFKYLILWNVKTLRYSTLLETWTTQLSRGQETFEIPIGFTDIAVFFPKQNILVNNNDECIQFRDCHDFDSPKIITTLNNDRRIHNLIVSKDEQLLISICELCIFKLWNIRELDKITLSQVIYFNKEELAKFRFTKDICCYSLYREKGEKLYYLEQLNLANSQSFRALQEFQKFDDFSIMQQQTIIAFGGSILLIWNYITDEKKQITGNNNQCCNSVVFVNNSDLLAAAIGCDINLFKVSTEPLDLNLIQELKGHKGKITCLSIFQDNSIIVSGSQDQTIRFWSMKQLATVQILKGFIVIISKITLSPNGKDMAVAMEDGSIRLYNLKFPKNIHEVNLDQISDQGNYIHCYRIFGRDSLISANNCILSDTVIEQDGKSLERLFEQKGSKIIKQ